MQDVLLSLGGRAGRGFCPLYADETGILGDFTSKVIIENS